MEYKAIKYRYDKGVEGISDIMYCVTGKGGGGLAIMPLILEIEVCDIRKDEGLRFRKDKDILPCITEHIHKDGGGQYTCLIIEKYECESDKDRGSV